MLNIHFNSIRELVKAFPDEQTCVNHLEQLRWNGEVVSPFDATSKVYKCAGNKYKCKATGKYFNVRTATLFDNTKVELQSWFMAIYLLTGHKKGISSMQLAKDLNVTQKTAWFMAHRIRACFGLTVTPDEDDKMGGEGETVQFDETFVGGKNKNRHKNKKVEGSQGRSFKDKTPVMGMLQEGTGYTVERAHKVIAGKTVIEKVVTRPSMVQLQVVPDTSANTIQPIIFANVKVGTTIVNDEWAAYNGLSALYDQHTIDHRSKEYVTATGKTTNHIEGFWTLFDRAYIGTYHYMSKKHLQKYADETAFRYNTRTIGECSRFNFMLAASTTRTTYANLIRK